MTLALEYTCNQTKDSIIVLICLLSSIHYVLGRKEGNVLFNDALNTFYLRLYGVTHMVKDHSDSEREETRCRHMGYSFRLTARVLLYASSNRQDNTYHSLCYTSRGELTGTRNSSMGPPITSSRSYLCFLLFSSPLSMSERERERERERECVCVWEGGRREEREEEVGM